MSTIFFSFLHYGRQAHYDFYMAGADVATTCSYQLSVDGCAKRGLSTSATVQLFDLSIQLAHRARVRARRDLCCTSRSTRTLSIVASLGCYGAAQADGSEYTGKYPTNTSVETLRHWHQERFDVFAHHPEVDLLAFETIPCLIEIQAICQLVRDYQESTRDPKPVYFSLCCRDGAHLSSRESVTELHELLREYAGIQVFAIGINCTAPQYIESLLREMQPLPGERIVCPNSGEIWDTASQTWHSPPLGSAPVLFRDIDPVSWIVAAEGKLKAIGGCCRVYPQDIAILRDLLHLSQRDTKHSHQADGEVPR